MNTAFYEEILSRRGDQVLMSNIYPATKKQIKDTQKLHQQGKCPHVIVRDEKGWPYDIRKCFTCGKDLGLV